MTEGNAKRAVFVVEDNDDILDFYVQFINAMPDMVVCGTARTAEEALQSIPQGDPDVALVDVSLPGMSGIDLVRKLRKKRLELPALMISGHDEELYAQSALEAGARGFIMKGDAMAIIRAIRQVLEGRLSFSDNIRQKLNL